MRALPVSIRKIKNHLNKQSSSDCENLDGKFPKSKVQPRSKRSKKLKFRYLTYIFFLCVSLLFQSVMRPVSALQPPSDAKGKNIVQEEKTCPKGHYLNPETKRCRKFPDQTPKTCPKGYFLNVKTNRCNKNPVPKNPTPKKPSSEKSKTKKPDTKNQTQDHHDVKPEENTADKTKEPKTCLPGYFLNKVTNRCNKEIVKTPKTCKDGYFMNKITGRCNKKAEPNEKKPCKAGQTRNPETGRCHKVVGPVTPKTCAEGKTLNPETNRCKKVEQAQEKKPCKEGYERHPETNRCRKSHQNTGAGNPVEVPKTGDTKEQPKKEFNGTTAVAGSAAIGLGIAIFQFKDEIFVIIRKIFLHK